MNEEASRDHNLEETRSLGSTPDTDSPTGQPGKTPERLGRYRILKRLGSGGMGTVFLAHDDGLDRRVALKVPQLSGRNQAEVIERFQREARAAANLDHPNLCSVYDVGEEDGQPYLAMAFIDGRSLSDYIRGAAISQRKAAALIGRVALALEQAHRSGVIHRDLKPANIMINESRQPVIVDFGLARRSGASSKLTSDGVVVGTPAYMSPEQILSSSQAVGASTDIYSLGVVLFEMLTGETPFHGDAYAVAAKVANEPPPSPVSIRADIDASLAEICLRALEKRPEDRFQSMAEFAAAIKAYLADPNARFKGQSADLADEELPQLAPLEATEVDTKVVLDTQLEQQLVAAPMQVADSGPVNRPTPEPSTPDFAENPKMLTLVVGWGAIAYGGYRCLHSLSGVLLGLVSFSMGGLALAVWSLFIGGLSVVLAWLGWQTLQRNQGAAERVGHVAIALVGFVLLGVVISVITTTIASAQLSASVSEQLEGAEGSVEAMKIAEATRRRLDLERSQNVSTFAGLWLLQLFEIAPLGFIIWAEYQLRHLPDPSD